MTGFIVCERVGAYKDNNRCFIQMNSDESVLSASVMDVNLVCEGEHKFTGSLRFQVYKV